MSKNPTLLNVFKFSFDSTVWSDSVFKDVTDEQLEDLLEFVAKKDITTVTTEESYGVFLLARKEMYWKLATSTAPLYSISVDGTSVSKNQRFDHYAQLITQLNSDYQLFLDSGGTYLSAENGNVGNTFLSNRHFDKRNYENTPKPIVKVTIDKVYSDKVEISWVASQITKFYNYIIYTSGSTIIDEYKNKEIGETNITYLDAKKEFTTYDRLKTKYRVEGLTPNTDYHIAVICYNANTVYGYEELTFKTEVI